MAALDYAKRLFDPSFLNPTPMIKGAGEAIGNLAYSAFNPEPEMGGALPSPGKPGSQELKSSFPLFKEKLKDFAKEYAPEQTVEGAEGLLDTAGNPLDLEQAYRDWQDGKPFSAILTAASVIPGVGKIAKAAKGAGKVAKAAEATIGHNSSKVVKTLEKAAEDFGPNELPEPRGLSPKTDYAAGLEYGPLPETPEGSLPVYLSEDARRVLQARADQMDLKKPQRVQPDEDALGLDLSEENYRRTYSDVPQTSLEADIPFPRATPGEAGKMPLGGRATPLLDTDPGGLVDRISDRMVADIRDSGHMGTNTQHFYGLYPLKQFLIEHGVEPDEAQRQIETFGKYYAATSPRTNTENNLRHASLLMALEKANPGIDLTDLRRGGLPQVPHGEKQAQFMPKGMNQMMDMHTNLANTLREGEAGLDLDVNTKPSLFSRASAGNVSDVVADTHNIRSILYVWNQLEPGAIPPAWLEKKKGARDRYAADPSSFNPATDVVDQLEGHTVDKKYRQTEYGVIAGVTRAVSKKLGISPGEAQALMWFVYGDRTGLDSAPKSIVQLIQERASVTGKLIGMDPKEVALKVLSGDLPLASVLGGAALGGAAMSGGEPPPGNDYAAGLKPDQENF